jgi:IS30 family transposase
LLIRVERKHMLTTISTLAHSIAPAAHRLKPLRVHVRTITHDNGKEFAEYRHLARILYIQVCFATPYHTGERGVNENERPHSGLLPDGDRLLYKSFCDRHKG